MILKEWNIFGWVTLFKTSSLYETPISRRICENSPEIIFFPRIVPIDLYLLKHIENFTWILSNSRYMMPLNLFRIAPSAFVDKEKHMLNFQDESTCLRFTPKLFFNLRDAKSWKSKLQPRHWPSQPNCKFLQDVPHTIPSDSHRIGCNCSS